MPPEPAPADTVGLLLAGGRARRMGGGDKCLRTLAGATLLERAIDRARPQVGHLLLNANGDPARFADFGLEVVADVIEGFAGPLAGVLSGMAWMARHRPAGRWLATFATDAPFFPRDLVARMRRAAEEGDADAVRAASAGRAHPVFGLWRVSLRGDLERAMGAGVRKIDAWTARHRLVDLVPDRRVLAAEVHQGDLGHGVIRIGRQSSSSPNARAAKHQMTRRLPLQ